MTLPASPLTSRALKNTVPMLRTLGFLLLTALFTTACAPPDPRYADDTVYLGGFHSAHTRGPRAH